MDFEKDMVALRIELMKVIERISAKKTATPEEIESLAKVAEAFILTYR